jgi:hypothetical protein
MGSTSSIEAVISDDGKVVVEMKEVEPDKLIGVIENYVRAGKTVKPRAKSHKLSEKDGDIVVEEQFEIPAMFGGGDFVHYSQWNVDAATGTFKVHFYPSEFLWKRNQPQSTTVLTVVRESGSIELFRENHKVRLSGKGMKAMLNKVLESHDLEQSAKEDQPSISAEGEFSAVTAPIEGGALTAENYFDSFKKFLVDEMGATDLPDGTIVEERSSMLGDLMGMQSFAKHSIQPQENKLCCNEYGSDESMEDHISTTYVQVHKNPFRLEQWNDQIAQRRAGADEKRLLEDFAKGLTTYMQEG